MSDRTSLYRHWDADGDLLYVGISLSAVGRLAQHSKASHWANNIASVTIETFGSRKEAETAERRAISGENPRHNIIHASNDNANEERLIRSGGQQPAPKKKTHLSLDEVMALVGEALRKDESETHGRTWWDVKHYFDWVEDVRGRPGKIEGRDGRYYPHPNDEEIALAIAALVGAGEIRMWGECIYPSRVGHYPFSPMADDMPKGEFFPPEVKHYTGTEITNRLQTIGIAA